MFLKAVWAFKILLLRFVRQDWNGTQCGCKYSAGLRHDPFCTLYSLSNENCGLFLSGWWKQNWFLAYVTTGHFSWIISGGSFPDLRGLLQPECTDLPSAEYLKEVYSRCSNCAALSWESVLCKCAIFQTPAFILSPQGAHQLHLVPPRVSLLR